MTATVATVAERAGVSTATVSRVLNGNYPVAASTRDRVEEAVRELDYVVNANARALASPTTNVLGLVLNDISDPFFGAIGAGVQRRAERAGALVLMASTGGSQDTELASVDLMRRQRVSAVILAGATMDSRTHRERLARQVNALTAQGCRVVALGRSAGVATVALPNHAGAKAIVEHLLSLGHKRIAHIAGPRGWSTTGARRRGWSAALTAAGVKPRADWVVHGDFSRDSGAAAAAKLLRDNDFTAVFVANDLMAAGALAYLREKKIVVPQRISVAGFDDIPLAADLGPSLTTVRLDLRAAGESAAELALDGTFTGKVRTPYEVVPRASTGVARRSQPRKTEHKTS